MCMAEKKAVIERQIEKQKKGKRETGRRANVGRSVQVGMRGKERIEIN